MNKKCLLVLTVLSVLWVSGCGTNLSDNKESNMDMVTEDVTEEIEGKKQESSETEQEKTIEK